MNKALLDKAIKSLTIGDVYLKEYHAAIKGDYDPLRDSEVAMNIQHRHGVKKTARVQVPASEGYDAFQIIRVHFDAAFRLLPLELGDAKGDPQKLAELTIAEVSALFVAEYLITSDDLDADAIKEFCTYNVGYHVWPYWREFAQSSTDRLHLPRVQIPFYRVPGGCEDGEHSSETDKKTGKKLAKR